MIGQLDAGDVVEWEVSFKALSFSDVALHLQLLVEAKKDPNFVVIQGGRGGKYHPCIFLYLTLASSLVLLTKPITHLFQRVHRRGGYGHIYFG